jgi:hypothetical protein
MAESDGTGTATEAAPQTTETAAPPSAPELGSLWQSDDLKGSKSLARYKSVDDLGKAYVEMERKFGERTGVAIPKDDSPPEAWTAFYQQLPGYPKDPSNYNVAPPELPPEAGGWQPEFVQTFLSDVAHKEGMTTRQVQAVFDFYAQFVQQTVQAQRDLDSTQINEAYDTLRQEWTSNTDSNILVADEYLRRTFGDADPWWETLITRKDGKAVPLKNLPGFIKMAHELGQRHGHDKFVQGDGTGGFMTPQLAEQRLSEAYAKHLRKEISDAELTRAVEHLQPIASSQRSAGR